MDKIVLPILVLLSIQILVLICCAIMLVVEWSDVGDGK